MLGVDAGYARHASGYHFPLIVHYARLPNGLIVSPPVKIDMQSKQFDRFPEKDLMS